MKTRLRWPLLLFPLLILPLAGCIRSTTVAPAPTAPKPMMAAHSMEASPCAGVKASTYNILVTVDGRKIASVTPEWGQVCPQQRVTWISSDSSLRVKVFWKRVAHPAGGLPPKADPCSTPAALCGNAPIAAPPGHVLEYGVRLYDPANPGTPIDTFDPILEVLD